ncbi:hypothetical protein IPL68_07815 [Candidatus Saccharibacteria bacterium]|nr:MAG: hypothetical protein IPL68_07815 [Candidatus Saccharibacteria bacterium]
MVYSPAEIRDDVLRMSGMVEKPGREKAPSNYAQVSSYLFEPSVLKYIENGIASLPVGEEFYVATSLVDPMLKDGHKFFGCVMQNSRRYDTGDKLEYLMTVVEFALRHKELGSTFRAHVEKLLKEL